MSTFFNILSKTLREVLRFAQVMTTLLVSRMQLNLRMKASSEGDDPDSQLTTIRFIDRQSERGEDVERSWVTGTFFSLGHLGEFGDG